MVAVVSIMIMKMMKMMKIITFWDNDFNEKCWAICGPKLSRPIGDLNDHGTTVPMLQIPNLSHHQDSDQIIRKPHYGYGVFLLKTLCIWTIWHGCQAIKILFNSFYARLYYVWSLEMERTLPVSSSDSEGLINICCVPFNFIWTYANWWM